MFDLEQIQIPENAVDDEGNRYQKLVVLRYGRTGKGVQGVGHDGDGGDDGDQLIQKRHRVTVQDRAGRIALQAGKLCPPFAESQIEGQHKGDNIKPRGEDLHFDQYRSAENTDQEEYPDGDDIDQRNVLQFEGIGQVDDSRQNAEPEEVFIEKKRHNVGGQEQHGAEDFRIADGNLSRRDGSVFFQRMLPVRVDIHNIVQYIDAG